MKSIMLLEDSWLDIELTWRITRKIGLLTIVKDRKDFVQALTENHFDLIIVDLGIPTFLDFETVETAHNLQPQTPLLVLTGSITEERAVECIKKGAVSYVMKNSPARLEIEIKKALGLSL